MMTNLAFALVVVLAALAALVSGVWELLQRRARKAREMGSMDEELSAMLRAESHRLSVPSGPDHGGRT